MGCFDPELVFSNIVLGKVLRGPQLRLKWAENVVKLRLSHPMSLSAAARTQLAEEILVGVVEGRVGHAPNDANEGIKYHLVFHMQNFG